MPLGGPFLNNGQLAFIEKWILEGAPSSGSVANPLLLNDETMYEPPTFLALEEPSQGFQYHLGPFDVPPGGDREFFYYEPDVGDEDLFIKRVEISMRPGSHHFIFYTFENSIYRTISSFSGFFKIAINLQCHFCFLGLSSASKYF